MDSIVTRFLLSAVRVFVPPKTLEHYLNDVLFLDVVSALPDFRTPPNNERPCYLLWYDI